MIEEQISGDGVTVDQEVAEPKEDQEESSQGVTEEPQQQPQDDYYKNKAFELERKNQGLSDKLDKLTNLVETKIVKEDTSQYSEDQLKAALSNPEGLTPQQQAFAQSELKKIEDRKQEERDERLLKSVREEQRREMTRQQAEQQVLNDTRFQEAFVRLPNGQVQWNQNSQMAQMIGGYMNDPRIKDQPDAISIAAKLAYADMTGVQKEQELKKMKRSNEELKGQTMVEGGGKNFNKPTGDPFKDAMSNLKRSGAKDHRAANDAVKEYFRKRDGAGT